MRLRWFGRLSYHPRINRFCNSSLCSRHHICRHRFLRTFCIGGEMLISSSKPSKHLRYSPLFKGVQRWDSRSCFQSKDGILAPISMSDRSLFYVQSHPNAWSCTLSIVSLMYRPNHSPRTMRLCVLTHVNMRCRARVSSRSLRYCADTKNTGQSLRSACSLLNVSVSSHSLHSHHRAVAIAGIADPPSGSRYAVSMRGETSCGPARF